MMTLCARLCSNMPVNDSHLNPGLLGWRSSSSGLSSAFPIHPQSRCLLICIFIIRGTKLKQLNLEFSVPSPRKAPKGEVAAQLVVDQISADPAKRRGTGSVQSVLAVNDTPLPRFVNFDLCMQTTNLPAPLFFSQIVREVMKLYDPEGVSRRYPEKRKSIHRGRLQAAGPFHEICSDGHDKFNSQALNMGPVSIPIYLKKDKSSSAALVLRVVPDNRNAGIIGHLQCDFYEAYGGISKCSQSSLCRLSLLTKTHFLQHFLSRRRSTRASNQAACTECR